MFVKINDRRQIVEATDQAYGDDYIEIQGSVANNLPAGLLGFNGTVFTPNYTVVDGIVAARTEEDKAHDPYSDPIETITLEQRVEAVEAVVQGTPSYGELLEAVNILLGE